jgi:hypothetical protein
MGGFHFDFKHSIALYLSVLLFSKNWPTYSQHGVGIVEKRLSKILFEPYRKEESINSKLPSGEKISHP